MPGAQHAVPTEDNTTVLSPKEQLEQVAHYDRAASPQTPNQFHEAPDATPEQWNQAISCPEDKALDSPLLPASAFQDCTPAPPEPEEESSHEEPEENSLKMQLANTISEHLLPSHGQPASPVLDGAEVRSTPQEQPREEQLESGDLTATPTFQNLPATPTHKEPPGRTADPVALAKQDPRGEPQVQGSTAKVISTNPQPEENQCCSSCTIA